MPISSHIPLQFRKALRGRLAFYTASDGARLLFSRAGIDKVFDQIEKDVVSFTNLATNAIHGSQNDQRLDHFLSNLSRQIERGALAHEGQSYWDSVDRLVRAFDAETRTTACDRCSPTRVCDGSELDHDTVTVAGDCISPLKAAFDIAAEAARRYFLQYSSLIGEATLPKIVFSTAHTIAKPHDCPNNYFVSGSTSYLDHPGAATSRVTLFVCVNRFDQASLEAIPYVLFHECVCHAFQESVHDGDGRKNSEPGDVFAEGWMDWVAVEILRETALGKGPAAELGGELKTPDSVVTAGSLFHSSRCAYGQPDSSEHASVYAFGKSCAQKVLRLFQRLLGSQEEAWTRFLGISFDLNLLSLRPAERDAFLTRIYTSLPAPGQIDRPNQFAEVPPLFRRYLEDRDVRALVKGVTELYNPTARHAP